MLPEVGTLLRKLIVTNNKEKIELTGTKGVSSIGHLESTEPPKGSLFSQLS